MKGVVHVYISIAQIIHGARTAVNKHNLWLWYVELERSFLLQMVHICTIYLTSLQNTRLVRQIRSGTRKRAARYQRGALSPSALLGKIIIMRELNGCCSNRQQTGHPLFSTLDHLFKKTSAKVLILSPITLWTPLAALLPPSPAHRFFFPHQSLGTFVPLPVLSSSPVLCLCFLDSGPRACLSSPDRELIYVP